MSKPSFEMKFVGRVTAYHHLKEHERETSHMTLVHVGEPEYGPRLTASVSIEGCADFAIDDVFELAIVPRESEKHAEKGVTCRCAKCRVDRMIADAKGK